MNKLHLYTIYRMRQFGWSKLAGITLGLCAALWYSNFNLPINRQYQYLQKHASEINRSINIRQQKTIQSSPEAALNAFYSALPPLGGIPDKLEKIISAMEDHGLNASDASFKLTHYPQTSIAGYEILLPVSGNYQDIRDFCNQVLSEVPSASLDDISLNRSSKQSGDVDAKLRFTLYIKTAP